MTSRGSNITRLPGGRALLRITTPDGKRRRITFDTEAQASQARDAVRLDRQQRKLGMPGILVTRPRTLVQLIRDFRRDHDDRVMTKEISNRTLEHYYQCTAGVLLWLEQEGLAHLRPGELTDRHVARYMAWRKDAKLSKKARRVASEVQVRKDLVLLTRVYRWAGEEQRWSIPRKLPRHKGGKRVPEPEKLFAWLDVMPIGSVERARAETAIATALRPSDIDSLELDQLDLEERVFTLTTQKDGKRLIVPFDDDLAAHLRAWLAKRQATLHHRKLFHLDGQPLKNGTLRYRYRMASRQVGLKPEIEYVGGLRNAFVAYLLDEGENLSSIQRFLGHTDPRTTAIYGRGFLPMKLLRELAAKIQQVRRKAARE